MSKHRAAFDEGDLTYEAGMQALVDLKHQCPNDKYLHGDIHYFIGLIAHGRALPDAARILREEIIPQALGGELIALGAFLDELNLTIKEQ